MFSYNERHPIEHIIGFFGVLLLHILLIGGSLMFMRSPKKQSVDTSPLQVQVVEVPSATPSAVQTVQPPPPEMIVPPIPEIKPPPINIEAPVQPKKPPLVKQAQKQVPPPRESEDQSNKSTGDQGASAVRPPGVGTPDQSAGSKPLNGARIAYPPDMEEAGKEGRVILSCDVETDGSTNNCKVISAVGGNSFKEAALEYVHRARYSPATLNGKAVKELAHRYTITFRLGAND